ncbi:MAG: alginate lyase family protein [candidate division Zixibacteria bacterium]|nr:alginate lyase family protein [candidate division Zixibacteria bacterium]
MKIHMKNSLTNMLERLETDKLWREVNACVFHGFSRWAYKNNSERFDPQDHLRSLGKSEKELGRWVLSRTSGCFLYDEKLEKIRDYYDDGDYERSLIYSRADHVVAGKMPILSHDPGAFKGSDRWRRDHIHEVTAPEGFYADLDLTEFYKIGDLRHLREPNRWGWVYWLGPAYVLSGDKKYFERFAELTVDWFTRNRFSSGINYVSDFEISLRVYAWVWAVQFFRVELARRPQLLSLILKGIWECCQRLEKNLWRDKAAEIEPLGVALALYSVGAAFPEFVEAANWRSQAAEILSDRPEKRFLADGTHMGLTASAHLYATDIYVTVVSLARELGYELDNRVTEIAAVAHKRLRELSPKDLLVPQFNDCDGGRICWLAFHPLDSGPALISESDIFDCSYAMNSDRVVNAENVWLCGEIPEVKAETDKNFERTSVSSDSNSEGRMVDIDSDSGFIVHKSQEGDFLLLRCGKFDFGADEHIHDSQLSLALYLGGKPVLVDSGTGSIYHNPEIRKRFRGAVGKNTLIINGIGPSVQSGADGWDKTTDADVACARSFPGGFYFKGHHNGYSKVLGFDTQINREVIFFNEGLLLMVDSWEAERDVEVSLPFTLHPSLKIDIGAKRIFEEDGPEFFYSINPEILFSSTDNESDSSKGGSNEFSNEKDLEELDEDIRFKPKQNEFAYSPDYGLVGVTGGLVSDLGMSSKGSVTTVISRIGPVKLLEETGMYEVGLDEEKRLLRAGPAGKISLGSTKSMRDPKPAVEFVR